MADLESYTRPMQNLAISRPLELQSAEMDSGKLLPRLVEGDRLGVWQLSSVAIAVAAVELLTHVGIIPEILVLKQANSSSHFSR